MLGLDVRLPDAWPSQTDIAPVVNVTRGRIGQLVGKFQARWAKDATLTKLRELPRRLADDGRCGRAGETGDFGDEHSLA